MELDNRMEYSLDILLIKLNFLFGQESVGKEKNTSRWGTRSKRQVEHSTRQAMYV
jgi:hypothetical protein